MRVGGLNVDYPSVGLWQQVGVFLGFHKVLSGSQSFCAAFIGTDTAFSILAEKITNKGQNLAKLQGQLVYLVQHHRLLHILAYT